MCKLSLDESVKLCSFDENIDITKLYKYIDDEWEKKNGMSIKDISLVYHYTDINGLKGILENHSLWFSNAKYLNDNTELLHGIKLIKECIEEIKDNNNFADNSEKINNFFDIKTKLLISKIEDKVNKTYVLSLSNNSDSLMLWNGYSSYGGYNIGFNYNDLCNMLFSGCYNKKFINKHIRYRKIDNTFKDYDMLTDKYYPLASIHGVIYNLDTQKKLFYKYLKIFYDEICSKYYDKLNYKFVYEDKYKIFNGNTLDIVINELIETMSGSFSLFCKCFKNEGFYPEEEVRIIITLIDGVNAKEITKFRTSNNLIIPYLDVAFEDDNNNGYLPIKKITVGPMNNDLIAKEGIKSYLDYIGYDSNISVESSKITLRY